jgi:iron complex outermembrane receptor protein
MNSRLAVLLCGAATLLALPSVHPAYAQAAQQPAAGSAPTGLEEVVVTARRREENLQKIPVSVTAFSPAKIEELHAQTLTDIQYMVPSLNIDSNNTRDANNFNLRGQGTTYQADPAVVVYFAEVPLPFNGGGPGFYYDLDNIQVLKGPQGTLFGRNADGGAVLFQPKKPGDEFEGYFTAGFGNYTNIQLQGAVTVPIVQDKFSIRVAFDRRSRDGFTKDIYNGKDYDNIDYWAARVSAVMKPTDDIENYILFNSVYDHNNGTSALLTGVDPTGPALGIFGQPLLQALALQQSLGPRETFMTPDSIYNIWNYGVVDTLKWNLGEDLTLKNIFGWQVYKQVSRLDVGGTTLPILYYGDTGQYGGVLDRNSPDFYSATEELQFSGKALSQHLQWVAGAYFEFDHPEGHDLTDQIVFGQPIYSDVGKGVRSEAVYAQGDYDLSQLSPILDGFTFTGGYRYTWDYRTAYQDAYVPVAPGFTVCQYGGTFPNCTATFERHFQKGTYTLALKYQIDDATQVYVTGRTGFKSGGFNISAPPNSPLASFGPEKSTDVEVGVKSDFEVEGMKARTNVALYHTDYSQIDRALVYVVNGTVGAFVVNATSAEIEGAEFEGTLIPFSGLELNAVYSYTYSKYGSYVTNQGDFSGQVLPYVSKNKFDLSARYYLPVDPALGDISFAPSFSFQTRYKNLDNNDPDIFIASYGLLNLNFDWKNILGRSIDANLYVTNALDKVYRVGEGSYYTSLGVVTSTYGEPRMYGINLKYRFGGNAAEAAATTAAYTPPAAVAPTPVPKSYLVFFDFNKSDLTQQATAIVDQAAANAGPAHVTELTVTGHTDTVGSDAYNIRLSKRRAESVAARLEKDGIPSSEIAIVAKGKRDLLVPTKDGVREPQNRRVQIVYSGGAGS